MIKLYSTGCPKCKILEKKLNIKKIEFNLITDPNEIVKLGYNFAPLLEVDGKIMNFKEAIDWTNAQ